MLAEKDSTKKMYAKFRPVLLLLPIDSAVLSLDSTIFFSNVKKKIQNFFQNTTGRPSHNRLPWIPAVGALLYRFVAR